MTHDSSLESNLINDNQFEYDVVHIRGAAHVSIAKSTFEEDLEKATTEFEGKDSAVAFYCNGITCSKSYKAVRKAIDLGYTNAVAYDAGIFNWTKAYPALSTLLGETPADVEKIIPSAELEVHMLDGGAFTKGGQQSDAILIDARDSFQREEQGNPAFARNAKRWPMTPLSKKLKTAAFKQETKGKTLYVFDAVGKQVRWLQYHLKANGYTSYYFLKKGVKGLE